MTSVEDRFGNQVYSFKYLQGKFLVQLYRASEEGYYKYTNNNTYSQWWYNPSAYSGTLTLPVYLSRIEMKDGRFLDFTTRRAFVNSSSSLNIYPSLYNNGTPIMTFAEALDNHYKNYMFYYLQVPIDSIARFRSASDNVSQDPLSAMEFDILTQIIIGCYENGVMQMTKSYRFYYDTSNRLHLTDVQVWNNDNILNSGKIGTYSLKYNNYNLVPNDYLTQCFDHWGYYNGPNNETNPSQYLDSLRKVRPEYTQYGALTEIIYPTGGKSVLEYEQNDYSAVVSGNRQTMSAECGLTGGLRIKSITEYDDTTNSHILQRRRFHYVSPETGLSSGQLFQAPRYIINWNTVASNNQNATCNLRVMRNIPVIPLVSSFGYHVGYSYVKETYEDCSYKTYTYTNFSDFLDEPFVISSMDTTHVSPYDKYGELGFMRGRLLQESTFDTEGVLSKKKEYVYREDVSNMKHWWFAYATNMIQIPHPIQQGDMSITIFKGGIFKQYYPKYDVSKILATTRVDNGYVVDTTSYTRDNNLSEFTPATGEPRTPYFRRCKSETTRRNGEILSRHYGYPEYNSSYLYFTPAISVSTRINNNFVGKNETVYGVMNNLYVPVYELEYHTSGIPDTLVAYQSYLNNDVLKGFLETYQKKGECPTRVFWNKKGQQLARITCPYDLAGIVCHDSTAVGYIPANQHATDPLLKFTMSDGTSIFSKPQMEATVYTYNASGLVSSITSGNGYTSYYEYDGARRLTAIRDAQGHIVQRFTYNYATSQ